LSERPDSDAGLSDAALDAAEPSYKLKEGGKFSDGSAIPSPVPSAHAPWDEYLWGTEVTWPGGAKLTIDRNGNGTFTDASGESGVWDPQREQWVDPDTREEMHPQFGIPGFHEPE
jgi:hypothetical protein